MNFSMIFKVAILAILRNKTRSLLTCLGIIVGIAAVIAVLAIGKGASTMMLNEISTMGNNLMMVFPDWNRRGQVRSGMGAGQTMTAGDAEAITSTMLSTLATLGRTSRLRRGPSASITASSSRPVKESTTLSPVTGVRPSSRMLPRRRQSSVRPSQ